MFVVDEKNSDDSVAASLASYIAGKDVFEKYFLSGVMYLGSSF